MKRTLIVVGVLFALAPLWLLPVGLIVYGGGGGAISGLVVLAALIALQWPLLRLLQSLGLIPSPEREPSTAEDTSARDPL